MPFADPEQNRERVRERSKKKTEDRQEISKRLAAIVNPKRRKAASASLRIFGETYFAARFTKPWSADHLAVIAYMEEAVRKGGIVVIAMPRGTGKTSLVEVFVLWCLLSGLRVFVLLVGSDKTAAVEMLTSIKTELESNQLLADDFPREVGPFVLLEGEPRACNGQRYKGKRTHILWRQSEIVFATIPKSKASGAILRVAGITGRIRGAKFTRWDGSIARPDLIVPDDPQTDKSAKSKEMTTDREKILSGTVKGLAGVGVRPAIVMPCTVVVAGDLADRYLDPKQHPEARAVRTQMLRTLPSEAALKLWEEYRRIFVASREAGGDGSQATEFYAERREAMDEGCEPSWEHNFDSEEISAVQHAMNWLLFNPVGFWSECQNNPGGLKSKETKLVPELLATKLRNLPRLVVPKSCQYVTAYIDVHSRVLYYCVSAWEKQFGGGPIDYGTYPQQPVSYFSQDSAPVAMQDLHPGLVEDAWLMAGLGTLVRPADQDRLPARRLGADANRPALG